MRHIVIIVLILFSIKVVGQKDYKYPIIQKQETLDTIWGRAVSDPYRWLEDLNSIETQGWLKSQAKVKNQYNGVTYYPLVKYLSFFSHIDYKPIFKEGKYYFLYLYEESNQTPSLFYQKNEEKDPKFLFNPNLLDKNADYSIDGIALSGDNKTLALILARNSGDWKTIRFLDIESRKLLQDTVKFVKYSPIYWSGNGVFYVKYDVKNTQESFSGNIKGRTLYYHKIGTKQEHDILIYQSVNEFDDFDFEVTPHKQHLVVYHSENKNSKKIDKISLLSLPHNVPINFRDFILSSADGLYFDVIGELSGKLLVSSNLNAENGAIYKYDPDRINTGEIFTPQFEEKLESAKLVGNKLVKFYDDSGQSFAVISDSTGKDVTSWKIPDGYTFTSLSGSINDSIALYYFDSFFSPSSVYKINLNTFEHEPLSKTYVWFDNTDLMTEKVYYYSKDNTRVPMYLTHQKDIKLNGENPVILYGYGGFGISMNPFFNVPNIIFLNNGGILATPCLRGGGDFPGWHEKGQRLNKQNTFDDFISAAEYLISMKYTNANKIAAMGGSNGGLVVGSCMLQRPDLFKVVVSESGILDMLRYHLYNIGYSYAEEYGNITDSIDFNNLYSYSPVNNVKSGVNYPATLLVASDNDDRVLPFNSFKFLSHLQANGTGNNPYVLYYQENSGHSGRKKKKKRIETDAYIYSFIYKYLGIEKKIRYNEN